VQRSYRRTIMVGLLVIGIVWYEHIPEPTVLSFRIGQTFEEVAASSTYPVMERSNRPADDPGNNRFGATWVTKPAVIIHFNDPQHGFTLPPTKFAALGFDENRASTLATSPMLDKLPFDEAVAVLEDLQRQFKAGGWIPFQADGSTWFDFTPQGKKRLFAHLMEHDMQTVSLYVPKKYGMTFRLWCAKGCVSGKPPYLFMIDIGVGMDTHSWKPGDPELWELRPQAATAAPTARPAHAPAPTASPAGTPPAPAPRSRPAPPRSTLPPPLPRPAPHSAG